MQKIFLVEDDSNINELLLYALKSSGFEAFGFENSKNFWVSMEEGLPDLIILDIMLPDENGVEILKKIKGSQTTENIPVIMLTAKAEEMDKIKCFDFGADDYLVKPFSVLELVARIRVRLKGAMKKPSSSLSYKDIRIDMEKRAVFLGDAVITLTYKEFELLVLLINNKDRVLTRNQILENVWGFDFEGESRTVDMHIKTLRQKLLDGGNYIKTVRSVGYKLGE